MYTWTREASGLLPTSYVHGLGDHRLGQATVDRCLLDLTCVPHEHVARKCHDGTSFTTAMSPTTMTRSAMNPGFFRATDGFHEFDTVLHAKLQNLLLDTPKFAVMLADQSKRTRDPHLEDRVRVAVVDLTGDKICKPGYADWGSTLPITSGSTVKVAILYAAHQLLFDLNEMARTGGLRTVAALKAKADEIWSRLICPPDLDWLVAFDPKGPTVRVQASANLTLHLNQMVHRGFSGISVERANHLMMRLGFEYIASVMWQSGLRRSRGQGLWLRNSYQQKKISAPIKAHCQREITEQTPQGDMKRVLWSRDPTDDPGFRLTALSVVTFFTLLAQRRLVNEDASVAMEALLKLGCFYPLNQFAPIPGMTIRATKCGLTSEVMHVAMLRESTSGRTPRLCYALAVLVQDHRWKNDVEVFLHNFVKEIDKLIRENNP
jgi:hypothetical protein